MPDVRLHKVLAQAGVASRRASEVMIQQGRVQVNGQTVTEMGVLVNPDRDQIAVDGQPIQAHPKQRYIMLHKPAGYLSVIRDERGRPSLGNLIPDIEGLHPVGRLDLDSEGLILLTNDGALTEQLTHPRYEHPKEYHVLVSGHATRVVLQALRQGVELPDGLTSPARVEMIETSPWGKPLQKQTWLRMIIHEGRKRQIRRMCEAVGLRVQRLIRVRIGPLELGDLPPGAHRPLTRAELATLRRLAAPPSGRPRRSLNQRKTDA